MGQIQSVLTDFSFLDRKFISGCRETESKGVFMEAHNYQPAEEVMPRHFLQQIIMQESLSTIRVLALKT